MPSRFDLAVLTALSAVFLFLTAPPAQAAETASSELVIIREGDSVQGDLYATGVRVLIEGKVDGDLVALAAEDVTISGEVTGSVLALAPQVEVTGVIGGSLRVSANDLSVSGSIGGDLVAAVVSADLDAASSVGGDALVWAFQVEAAGSIGADLSGTQRRLDIEGSVGGDVDVSVGQLTVTGPLQVTGDLGYRSGNEAEGLDQVTVGGVVAPKSPLPPNIRVRALGLLARILTVLSLTMAAVLVAWLWPERIGRARSLVRSRGAKAWGLGALVMGSPLLLAGLAALLAGLVPASASLPLLAIFIPLVMVTAGVVLVLSLVAGVPAVLALGEALPGSFGVFGSILLGSLIVAIVWFIPLIGWLVPLLVLPLGLGGWMLSFRGDAVVPAAEPIEA
jgi:cytoskeletal protein CcmA (bactofilin family)